MRKTQNDFVMNFDDLQILNRFTERIREYFPTAEVRLFGSRARGTASPDSDMDVCVILDSLDREARDMISHIAWEVGFENDIVIVSLKYTRAEFLNGPRSVSPLVNSILHEGVTA